MVDNTIILIYSYTHAPYIHTLIYSYNILIYSNTHIITYSFSYAHTNSKLAEWLKQASPPIIYIQHLPPSLKLDLLKMMHFHECKEGEVIYKADQDGTLWCDTCIHMHSYTHTLYTHIRTNILIHVDIYTYREREKKTERERERLYSICYCCDNIIVDRIFMIKMGACKYIMKRTGRVGLLTAGMQLTHLYSCTHNRIIHSYIHTYIL